MKITRQQGNNIQITIKNNNKEMKKTTLFLLSAGALLLTACSGKLGALSADNFTVTPNDYIPILPLKGVMLFPNNILPIGVNRKSSQKLVGDALHKNKHIGVFSQTDDEVNKPGLGEIYHTGVIAKVIRIIRLPDGSQTALLQGFQRIRLISLDDTKSYLQGQVELFPEDVPPAGDRKFSAVVEACRDQGKKLMHTSESLLGAVFAINNIRCIEAQKLCGRFLLEITEKLSPIIFCIYPSTIKLSPPSLAFNN